MVQKKRQTLHSLLFILLRNVEFFPRKKNSHLTGHFLISSWRKGHHPVLVLLKLGPRWGYLIVEHFSHEVETLKNGIYTSNEALGYKALFTDKKDQGYYLILLQTYRISMFFIIEDSVHFNYNATQFM